MTALLNLPRAAWKQQPTGRVTVNWSHPSTRRLRFAFSGGTWVDAVTGQSLAVVGSPSRTPTSDGVALTVEGSGTGTRLELGINPTVPTTAPVSVLTKARCFLTTLVRKRLFQLNNATTGAVVVCDFGNGSMTENRIGVSHQTTEGTFPGKVSTADYVAHTPYALLFTHDGSSSSYVDITRLNGPLSVTNTVSPGARRSAIDTIRLGNSSSFPFNGSLPYLFFWDRLISTDEAALIYQNPWALFASAPSRFILIPSSGGVITLIVQNATHGHSADNISLTQAHVLALADSLHGHSVESPILSQAYALTLAAAAHAHNADNLNLEQAHSLSVADASHGHSVESPTLWQAHILNLSDALHGHSAEAPTLTVAGSLSVADASHSHSADAVTLTQAHTVAVADSLHGHTADAVTLTQAYVLVTADTVHSHSSDALTLSSGLNLAVADALHAHTVETPGLTQAHVLSLADALHGHSVDSVSMGQGFSLVVSDASHSHSVESPTVSVAFVLAIQDALHSQAADTLALATHITLVVSDALHAHLAGSASEISLPTGDRIFLVAHEDRLFLVATEDRLFGV